MQPAGGSEHHQRPHQPGLRLCREPRRDMDCLCKHRQHAPGLGRFGRAPSRCVHRRGAASRGRRHPGGPGVCAASPDGAWFVSACNDGTLKVWDTATGRMLRTIASHSMVRWHCDQPGRGLDRFHRHERQLGSFVAGVGCGQTGECLRTHPSEPVGKCAVSAGWTWIAIVSDSTLGWTEGVGGGQRPGTAHAPRPRCVCA